MAKSSVAARKKSRVGLLLFLLLLVVILAALLLHRPLIELYLSRTASPTDYLLHAQTRTESDIDRALSLVSKLLPEDTPEGRSVDELSLTLHDTTRELLKTVKIGPAKLDWIESLGLKADVQTGTDSASASAELLLNETHLLTVDAQAENGRVSLLLPEVSDQALYQALDGVPTDAGALGGNLLSLERRYQSLALSLLPALTKGSGELSAGGVSMRCVTLTTELNETEMRDLVLALLRQAQDDPELLALLQIAGTRRGENFRAALGLLEKALEENGFPEGSYTMTVYVSRYGRICGQTLRFAGAQGEKTEQRLALTRKGGRFGLELSGETDRGSAVLSGSFLLRGKTLGGTLAYEQNGTELLTLDGAFAVNRLHNGGLAFTLTPARELLRMLPLPEGSDSLARDLTLALDTQWSDKTLRADLSLNHDSDALVKLALTREALEEPLSLELPEGLEKDAWLKEVKLPGLFGSGSFGTVLDNCKAAGMPAELVTGLKLLIPSLVK